jgi:hypothetical protein
MNLMERVGVPVFLGTRDTVTDAIVRRYQR